MQNGDLTSLWDDPNYNTFPWGARVAHVYNITGEEIPNASNGSVALLNFTVIGEPDETSWMNLSPPMVQCNDRDPETPLIKSM